MGGTLKVAIPRMSTAWYLVRADLDVQRARDLARRTIDKYARGPATDRDDLVSGSAASITAVTGRDLMDLTSEQRAVVSTADKWLSVRVTRAAEPYPHHEWMARTLAGWLAWSLEVPVADMTTGALVSADMMLASLEAKEEGYPRMADWVRVAYAEKPRGLSLVTRGMSRYGLPEVTVEGVSVEQARQWCALLTAIGFAVRGEVNEAVAHTAPIGERWPSVMPAEVEIADTVYVSPDIVGAAYCLPGDYWAQLNRRGLNIPPWDHTEDNVRLALDPSASGALRVEPLGSGDEPAAEFVESMCDDWLLPVLAEAIPFVRAYQEIGSREFLFRIDGLREDLFEPAL